MQLDTQRILDKINQHLKLVMAFRDVLDLHGLTVPTLEGLELVSRMDLRGTTAEAELYVEQLLRGPVAADGEALTSLEESTRQAAGG